MTGLSKRQHVDLDVEYTSDLYKASQKSKSLKTTVPVQIIEDLGLTDKDKLVWVKIIRDNKIVGAEVRRKQ